jgi:hypothetical protein
MVCKCGRAVPSAPAVMRSPFVCVRLPARQRPVRLPPAASALAPRPRSAALPLPPPPRARLPRCRAGRGALAPQPAADAVARALGRAAAGAVVLQALERGAVQPAARVGRRAARHAPPPVAVERGRALGPRGGDAAGVAPCGHRAGDERHLERLAPWRGRARRGAESGTARGGALPRRLGRPGRFACAAPRAGRPAASRQPTIPSRRTKTGSPARP